MGMEIETACVMNDVIADVVRYINENIGTGDLMVTINIPLGKCYQINKDEGDNGMFNLSIHEYPYEEFADFSAPKFYMEYYEEDNYISVSLYHGIGKGSSYVRIPLSNDATIKLFKFD